MRQVTEHASDELSERFLVEHDGRRICTLVFDLIAYTALSFPECAEGVRSFYGAFVRRFGNDVKWYATETMADEKAITAKVWTMVDTWFAEGAKPRSDYGLYLHTGSTDDDQRPPAFHMFSHSRPTKAKFLRMMLPVSVATDPAAAIAMSKEALTGLPFVWGTAGFAVYYNVKSQGDRFKTGARTGPLLMRHPGVDSGNPLTTSFTALQAVKTVNWLTILGRDLSEAVGGMSAIGKRAGSSVTLHALPQGVIIQAGDRPQPGDVNRDEPLPAYAAVARAIGPVLATEHSQIEGLSREQTERWLRRFDA